MSFLTCPRCQTKNSAFNPECIGCGGPIEEVSGEPTRPGPAPNAERAEPTRVGDVLGAYRIDQELSSGNTGAVFLARHVRDDVVVALKVLHPRLLGSAEARRRFGREARALARVSHPNVGRILDVIEEPPLLALVLEHLSGASLETRLSETRFVELEVRRVIRDVALGLGALHAAGVVHRDVKPSNIVFVDGTDGAKAKLIDLGLVRILEDVPGSMRTAGGALLGSLAYSAPELVIGEAAEPPADLWSLGVVAYEMLTGLRPFEAPSRAALATKILSLTPAPLECDPSLARLVSALLEKDPENRPSSAAEVVAKLEV